MIATAIGFLAALGHMQFGWRLWLGGLVLMNFVAPLVFIRRREAKIVIAVFLIQGTVMAGLFAAQGFTRLLGLAHFGWFWILYRLLTTAIPDSERATPWGLWLRALMAVDAVSLSIDVTDVVRFCLGERAPLM